MKVTIKILIIALLSSCKFDSKEEQFVFSIPTVFFQDSMKNLDAVPFERQYVDRIFPFFCGKCSKNDSVKFNNGKIFKKNEDVRFQKDWISSEFFEQGSRSPKIDSIETDGFKMVANYSQTILFDWNTDKYNAYFPVFLYNSTKKTKILIGKDNYVFAIQEAKDAQGNWRPIEEKGHDFCGVGYWGLKFQPTEFSTILIRKYKGSFETDLRIRLRNGKNTIISEVFRGHINPKQFYFKYRDSELDSFRKSNMDNRYFGAIPIELDSLIEQPKMIPR